MEPLKVFISSVMRREQEDLFAERNAAQTAVRRLHLIAEPYAFENEAASSKRLRDSYLDEVKSCDLMVLIVGTSMTAAVRDEVQTARDHEKRILAFVKETSDREAEAENVLRLADVKYALFASPAELESEVYRAVALEIRRRAKGGELIEARGISPSARLHELKRKGMVIRIGTIIPTRDRDLFRIERVEAELLILNKSGTGHQVTIPLRRVTEVLDLGPNDAPMVRIDGRLQWLTLAQEWKFLPDGPMQNDPFHLGVPKEVGRAHPVIQNFTSHGYEVAWSRRDMLAGRIDARTHEVFYDGDGYYYQSDGAVLVVRTPWTGG